MWPTYDLTCPSGLAKHSPHHAVLEGEKSRLDTKEDFLLGIVLRLVLVTLKMGKQCN